MAMRKSLLNLYMQKVAEGDRSYVERLCKQLADRLIFAPIVSPSANTSGTKSKSTFSVLRISEASRSLVPVFTSEKRFKEWGEKKGHNGGSISLLGGDFCAALGTDTWLTIDPGFEEGLPLEPSLVVKISECGLNEEPAQEDLQDSIEIEIPAIRGDDKPQPIAEKEIDPPGSEAASESAEESNLAVADSGITVDAESKPIEPKRKKSFLSFLKGS